MLQLARRPAPSVFFPALACTLLAVMAAPASAQSHARKGDAPADKPVIKNVFWQPNQLQQGSPAFFSVELDRVPTRVTATWINKTIPFFKSDNPKVWVALAGADLETQPGSYELAVTAVLPNGRRLTSKKSIDLATANFQSGSADVPEKFVEPDAAQKKQIAADQALKTRAFARLSPKPLWSGNFLKPVDVPPTPSFGESRLLNEEQTSTHRGTDYPVKEGIPVLASNAGAVVLARELFYEGNCVIIDHGQKVFTIYMHLSKIDAKLGQHLQKGAKIGLSGATGRVTGPHVHFGVRWNGANLDPVQLLALTLPKTGAEQAAPTRHSVRSRRPH